MSTITIEKRTRALITDVWGSWATTTDVPPYIDTTLVEYKTGTALVPTEILITDLTDNVQTDAEYVVTGDGVFDKLMESINAQTKAQHRSTRLTGANYAKVYLGSMSAALSESMRFIMSKQSAEENTNKLRISNLVDDSSKQDKIDTSKSALAVTLGVEPYKITLGKYQSDKALADVNMTGAQQTALEEQVIDNRYIKAIDSLSSTYGTFGAGGLTVSSDQWNKYYTLIGELVEDLRDYKGEWDATGVFPGAADGVLGDFYVVSVGGSIMLDGIKVWTAGDITYYDGAKWKKLDSTPASTTVSVVV